MSYSCKILLDSISETGKRLTTFEITFPRCVLAEAETHRVFRGFGGNIDELVIHNLGINVDENLSRNSASSRAIPINKMLDRVINDPFIPEKWGKPSKGMGAKEYYETDSPTHKMLTKELQHQLDTVIAFVSRNKEYANKEDLNRYLEPFMWHTAIISATEFDNFFKLRTNEAADWKIRRIADLMYEAYHYFGDKVSEERINIDKPLEEYLNKQLIEREWSAIIPQRLKIGEWHCPLVYEKDNKLINEFLIRKYEMFNGELFAREFPEIKKRISVARCARVSYLTHDGKRDIEKDLELFERLRTSGHWSPFEHIATPYFERSYKGVSEFGDSVYSKSEFDDKRSGNFIGWKQYRKEFADENCTNFRKEN